MEHSGYDHKGQPIEFALGTQRDKEAFVQGFVQAFPEYLGSMGSYLEYQPGDRLRLAKLPHAPRCLDGEYGGQSVTRILTASERPSAAGAA